MIPRPISISDHSPDSSPFGWLIGRDAVRSLVSSLRWQLARRWQPTAHLRACCRALVREYALALRVARVLAR